MLFVKNNKLKPGMRLARPIYNKDGVLLYERNSKLTKQGIQSIKAFGLIGLFILEPAEPVPPMTQEDILFERFQTMTVFSLREELLKIKDERKHGPKLRVIVNNILRRYGQMDKRINFIQNLRSKEDYVYKHSLNVAILCALMTHVLDMSAEEQMNVVTTALLHDVGRLSVPKAIAAKDEPNEDEMEVIETYEVAGYELIGSVFSDMPVYKRLCVQMHKTLEGYRTGETDSKVRLSQGAKVLMVAETYDTMTAMRLNQSPESEVTTIKYLLDHPELFDAEVVDALIQSVNILVPGVSVELNTKEKAIVIRNNEYNVLRPMVLGFRDNNIMDLADKEYKDLEIADIMKTMDNRYIIDAETLRANGINVPVEEEAEMQVGIEEGSDMLEEAEPTQEAVTADEEEAEEEYIPGQI